MSRLEISFLRNEGENGPPSGLRVSMSLYHGLHTGPLLLLSCRVEGLRLERTGEELLVLWGGRSICSCCWRPGGGAAEASSLEPAETKCTESLQQ